MMANRILNNTYVTSKERDYDTSRNLVISQSQLTYTGSGAIPSMDFKLPVGKTVYVDMGDGSALKTVNGNDAIVVSVTHTYSTSQAWTITFTGDLDTITYFIWYNDTNIGGDVCFCANWTALEIIRLNTTGIIGDISSWSKLLSLTSIRIYSTSITGDAVIFSTFTGLTLYAIYNTGISDYTASSEPVRDACTLFVYNLSWSESEVNQFLINVDATSVASTKSLRIDGNTAPSGAGITASTSLAGKGWTVTTD